MIDFITMVVTLDYIMGFLSGAALLIPRWAIRTPPRDDFIYDEHEDGYNHLVDYADRKENE